MKNLICLFALLSNPVVQVILALIFIAILLPEPINTFLCNIVAWLIVLFVFGLVFQIIITILK